MLAGEDEAGTAHVGSELIHLIEAPIDDGAAEIRIAQVANYEIVRRGGGEVGEFQVGATDPEPVGLQPLHQVTSDETPSAADQRTQHAGLFSGP